ncbi:MAG TPA: antitoxin Xre/MbcA/ParS toxin-binding domain-containing protein [Chthoniobacterales bacterium]
MKLPEPPGIEKIAEKFGLRQETLSRMTGFSLRAVAGWSNGKIPSTPVRRALVEMDRLLDSLARLMKPKDVGRWLKEPNAALDGSTPVQVIERGQTDRIWRLLYFLESGEPG